MNGLLSRQPYPNDAMTDVIAVSDNGGSFALVRADAQIRTQLPDGTYRASQQGDVLCWTGTAFEGRTVVGPWETKAMNGSIAVYCTGDPATARGFLFWTTPNV